MATSDCRICGGTYHWFWEEAFDKFGFGDGKGQVETEQVRDFLVMAGCVVELHSWESHNTVIRSIVRDGIELIPETASVGYDDPRKYLPRDIVRMLDGAFPSNTRGIFLGEGL